MNVGLALRRRLRQLSPGNGLGVEEFGCLPAYDFVEAFILAEALDVYELCVLIGLVPFHKSKLANTDADFNSAFYVLGLVGTDPRARVQQASVRLDTIPILNETNQYFHLKLCRAKQIKEFWRSQKIVFFKPQTKNSIF